MFCAKCGKDLPDGTKFCGGCGEKVDSSSVESAAKPAQAPAKPAYTPPPQPAHGAQPAYVAPGPQVTYNPPRHGAEPLSVGNYVGTLLLLGIPFVGFILLLIWAFDSSTNLNKKNLARAMLILSIIGIALAILFWGILISIIYSIFN